MKNIIESLRKNYKWALVVLGAGFLLGWLIFRTPGGESGNVQESQNEVQGPEGHNHENGETTIWTCSMHPQIRQDEPGKCPICAMDLIPLSDMPSGGDDVHPDEISMTESAAQLANIQTIRVTSGTPGREILLQGKVQADERRISELTARFGGRIEKLFVSFTGENVDKGQKLATIYSPALVTAQRELLEAMAFKSERPALYKAARTKLRLWDLTEDQIDHIEEEGEPRMYFDILSPGQGTVTKRHVALGDYVKEGTPLFQVIDLTHVWIMLDAYESDLPWIGVGDPVTYTLQSVPDRVFSGKITYIDPLLDPVSRVVKVRAEQNNPGLLLKPEMFVKATIESKVAASGDRMMIPKSSVLWTGKRSVVYVKVPDREQPSFMYRQITLGPESENFYVVEEGLSEGEEVAVNGVFKIDAAAQLAGKRSMMNPQGEAAPAVHDHGSAMQMSNTDQPEADTDQHAGHESGGPDATMAVPEAFRKQLRQVADAYINMIEVFVASDPDAAAEEAGKVKQALDGTDMGLLEGEAHMEWMEQLNKMESSIDRIAGTGDLDAQRQALSTFSDALYASVKSFGLDQGTLYYQYCPMANEDKGAYWLSTIEDIRNPYFGDMMLSCGETRETLEY